MREGSQIRFSIFRLKKNELVEPIMVNLVVVKKEMEWMQPMALNQNTGRNRIRIVDGQIHEFFTDGFDGKGMIIKL